MYLRGSLKVGKGRREGLKGERTPIDNTTSDFERCRKAIKII